MALDPSTISGLEVWLDASQLALADGANVSVWTNMGSGAQPTLALSLPLSIFKTNVTNGKSVVRFGAGGTRLRGTVSSTHDFTIIYITRRWGTTVGRSFSTQLPPTNIPLDSIVRCRTYVTIMAGLIQA
jgi:hypothetical protein